MLLCFAVIGVLSLSTVSATNSSESEDVADAYFPPMEWSDAFDWKLLKAFSTPDSRNVLISPIGLKLVLALLYEGSGGYTEKEFQNVLQFSLNKQEFGEHFKKILTALQPSERSEYILNLGSRIFLDSRLVAQQKFAAKASHVYRTSIEKTNFTVASEASLTINSWIDKLTNGKVPQLVSPGDLEDAIMIIANAIYFKGTWRHQFPKNNTALGGFYVSSSEIVTAPFMTTTDTFYYFESNTLDAKILRLPYRGQNYALFILLPNSKTGLAELIKKVNLHLLKKELYLMDKVPVEVRLPKFKFNFQSRFSKTLQDFGLRQMFQNTASFPGIARGIPNLLRMLVVSDIIQKTGIEVDEEGSVVYAASEVQVGNKFGVVDYIFNASHPFLFFLEEQTNGTILFVGKVENPLDTNGIPLPQRFGTPGVQSSSNSPNLQPSNPEREAVTRRFNYFDLELLREYSESSDNVFISPANIKTTLALILEGAKGRSAEEIRHALRIEDINDKEIREILDRLLFDLNDSTSNTVLKATTSLFVSDKYHVLPEYENKLTKYYKGTVKNLDFTDTNKATNVINSWVSNATNGLIEQIVDSQSLQPDTSLILSNALYFKGKWKTEFDPKNTEEKCFYSPTRGCVNVKMMQLSSQFNYNFNIELNAHAIELPYEDDKYAMLILLPNNGNNVSILGRDMQHTQLTNIIDSLSPLELIVEIPRFEIEYQTELVSFLRPLRITEIFGRFANLSGIFGQENVKISSIIHRTRIEVNEQGTKAAAATAAIVVPLMGSQIISADHPFIFFIYHKESRNIIFQGIFMEPTSAATPVKTARIKGRSNNPQYFQSRRRIQ